MHSYVPAIRGLVTVVALCCAVVGCHSREDAPAGARTGAPAVNRIDACSMVSSQDVAGLLGATVQGKSTGRSSDMGSCIWENAVTEESVSVEIGNPGTAPNNTLPPPESGFPDPTTPGPDGMRFLGGGGVEFAAGDRTNSVQVAVLKLSANEANSAALVLARKIAPQVPK
ncbi:hypothetical protein [Mycolicibacterium sp. HS_4_1]